MVRHALAGSWRFPSSTSFTAYDATGYHYQQLGQGGTRGPKPWQELGDTGIGALEVYNVSTCDAATPRHILKDACGFALRHAEAPEEWVFPGYSSGPAAFEVWAAALDAGTASRFGQGYNGEVWAEARTNAVDFLHEAQQRVTDLSTGPIEEAITQYSTVRDRLQAVAEMYPFAPTYRAEDEMLQSPDAARLLREAGTAETAGLEALSRIADELQD